MSKSKKFWNILEIITLITILFLIDIRFNYFGYIAVDPNPYLVFTILIAVRYGMRLALFSSTLSYMFTLISIYLMFKEEFFYLIFTWDVLRIPIFLLSFALIIGFFRDLYVNEINSKEMEIYSLKQKNDELSKIIEKQNVLIKNLENKLLLSREFSPLLIRKLKILKLSNLENVLNEVFDTIDKLLEPKSFSIYSISKNNFLRLKMRKGITNLPNSFPIENSYLISKAMQFGYSDIKSIILEEDFLNKNFPEPLMVASIYYSNEKESLYGFLIIEDIEEPKINKNTATYLKMLADWTGTLIQNSTNISKDFDLIFEDMKKFDEILNEIENRRIRYNIPYSVIVANTDEPISILELKKFIRDTDFLFYDGRNLKIILTASDSNGLSIFLNRLKEHKKINVLEAYSKE